MGYSTNNNPSGQKGLALLALIILIVFVAMAYFMSNLSVEDIKQRQNYSTSQILQQAKQALISYAVIYSDIDGTDVGTLPDNPGEFGFLPCPDYSDSALAEGNEDSGSCGLRSVSKLGYLPWRALGMGLLPPKDNSNTCLLYAVTGEYKNNASATKSSMLNEDSYGMFQVVNAADTAVYTGNNAGDRVVAIVFAPGVPLPGQSRGSDPTYLCGRDYGNFGAYLELNNASLSTTPNDIDKFVHAIAGSDQLAAPYNDRFVTITRSEIWEAIMQRDEFDASLTTGGSRARRVTEALARCLAQYGNDNDNRHLPYPVFFDLNGNDYRDKVNYDDVFVGSHFGRFPYIVASSDSIIPGTISPIELFNKNFTAPPTFQGCDDLPILSPAGVNADLFNDSSEDRIFWENRKDHFFYAVSDYYWPSANPTLDPAPRCGNCITVNAVNYAAVVIYSGEKQAGQTRDAPIAVPDTIESKSDPSNYVEVVNAIGDGTGNYTPTGNDVMFCITDTEPLDVVSCP